jgi:putative two-component system response regulator
MKILIVDDDDIALEILQAALQGAGYSVVSACDGRAALQCLDQHDVRLVISDWKMPEMDGIDLCRAIRRRDSADYIYFILLTSQGSQQQIVEGMSAGADDFIVKPFNHAELMARVRAGERVLSQESREIVIFLLAKLAESRDPETGQHLERVQRYAKRLAETLAKTPEFAARIDPDFIRLVYQTSPLHDIGKVGIPDSVLLKPGRLSAAQFEIMKTHTTLGASTLDAALKRYPHARFLQVARDIAASHHERWDGSGYPFGIVGQDIPLMARIVAVVDTYDALASERPYKEAFPEEKCLAIIKDSSGSHFDPEVVEAFFANIDRIRTIRKEWHD